MENEYEVEDLIESSDETIDNELLALEQGRRRFKKIVRWVSLFVVLIFVGGMIARIAFYNAKAPIVVRDPAVLEQESEAKNGSEAFTPLSIEDFDLVDGDYFYEDDKFDIISYGHMDDINIDAINDLYSKYDQILEMMNHESMEQLKLYFYGDRDTYLETGIPSEFIAYYLDGHIHVLNPNAKGVSDYTDYRDDFDDFNYSHYLLVHEFIHGVHHHKIGSMSPEAWINEGIAEYISIEALGYGTKVYRRFFEGQEIPFDSFTWLNATISYRYIYGRSIVDYLVDQQGLGVISALIQDPTLSDDDIMLKLVGTDMDGFFETWEAFMIEEYGMVAYSR